MHNWKKKKGKLF
jgi:hypothetical protein